MLCPLKFWGAQQDLINKFERYCSNCRIKTLILILRHSALNLRVKIYLKKPKQRLITRTSFVYKTLRLVRISLLINVLNKGVLLFFWGKLFYKSNRKRFSCVCISWYKHSRGWENSRQLCKPSTSSRVCITVSNSPNPSRVYIRLCKHGKRFLLLK